MAKSTKKESKRSSIKENILPISSALTDEKPEKKTVKPLKTGYIVATLSVIIVVLFAINRGYLFAAIINNKPLFRWNLSNTLMSRYGSQTLENMITQELIADQARQAHVQVTQQELDAKEQELLKSFGGNVSIDDVLNYQGMTRADFDEQMRLQILLTKLIGKDITISNDEVTAYIASNQATMVATTADELQKEAKEILLNQKIGEKLQTWYADIKSKAKIYRFIK